MTQEARIAALAQAIGAEIGKLSKLDVAAADLVSAINAAGKRADVAALLHAAAAKPTPADADELALADSAASWGFKKFTWANLKAALQLLFFHRGSIVGTVSQSGGVPTGAVIQYGSNANGWFVRLADGTQLCVRRFTGVPTSSVAAFAQVVPSGGGWTFPAAFVSSPAYLDAVPVEANSGYFYGRCVSISASGFTDLYLTNTYNGTTTSPATLLYIAIGRWF